MDKNGGGGEECMVSRKTKRVKSAEFDDGLNMEYERMGDIGDDS